MARLITIDQFASSIHDILEKYGDEINENMEEAVKAVSRKGAQAVKSAASSTFNGSKYASGWTSKTETGRTSSQGTIYNRTVPGLPHLLENGHAMRGGGRVAGRPHIKPVEEKIIQEFEQEVRKSI